MDENVLDLTNSIPLNISYSELSELKKINLEDFKNGILIIDLIGFEIFPITSLHKELNGQIIYNVINNINTKLKDNNVNVAKMSITTIVDYVLINNNVLIFRCI